MSDLAHLVVAEFERADAAIVERLVAVIAPLLTAPAPPLAYTTRTLAAELGLTDRAIRSAIARGELVARRSGRTWLIAREDVVAWVSPPASSRRRRTQGEGPRPGRRREVARDAMRRLA